MIRKQTCGNRRVLAVILRCSPERRELMAVVELKKGPIEQETRMKHLRLDGPIEEQIRPMSRSSPCGKQIVRHWNASPQKGERLRKAKDLKYGRNGGEREGMMKVTWSSQHSTKQGSKSAFIQATAHTANITDETNLFVIRSSTDCTTKGRMKVTWS